MGSLAASTIDDGRGHFRFRPPFSCSIDGLRSSRPFSCHVLMAVFVITVLPIPPGPLSQATGQSPATTSPTHSRARRNPAATAFRSGTVIQWAKFIQTILQNYFVKMARHLGVDRSQSLSVITSPAIDDLPGGLAWIMMCAATHMDRGPIASPRREGKVSVVGTFGTTRGVN